LESDDVLRLTPRKIRVCIADGQQMWRAVYRMALQRRPDIEVVCSFGSTYCSSLAAATVAHSPDVLLVGVRTLRLSDVRRLKQIVRKHPAMGVVALYGKRFSGTRTEDEVGLPDACVFMHRGEVDTAEQLGQVVRAAAELRAARAVDGVLSGGHSRQMDAAAPLRYSALPA
jgi:chemotaxis response regulator CheB